ncbi:MAG: hypothetical protein Q7W55_03635 [Pseudohongiella sp.]|nr:hypothetical protein [Pseudohongiella sp.]
MTGIREQIIIRCCLTAGAIVALYFVLTVIAGISLSYSPVPFWDMWGGTLNFYLAVLDGNTNVWWTQHNEHRIILSRLLFWLDFQLAGGSGVLLLATHPILAGLAAYVFYLFCRQLIIIEPDRARVLSLLCATFFTAWLFQWMQAENFTWAFQSQFFLAQLLPLLTCYLLARSATTSTRPTLWFSAACVAGVASAGTMANGIICLPLMMVYALVTRQSWQRVLVLAVLAAITLSLYFRNYWAPRGHGSVTQALLEQPLDLAQYVLLYIGTPFYFLLGAGIYTTAVAVVAMVATVLMAIVVACFLVTTTRALLSGSRDPRKIWQLALVFYIIYLAGTALGTGGGRLVFGVNQALAYRYTTPALMAWAALFVLLIPGIVRHWRSTRLVVVPAVVVLCYLMISLQLQALNSRQQQIFERSLAALALELDIRDAPRILAVHEMSSALIHIVDLARRRELSVFGNYPLQGLREQLGRFYQAPEELPSCEGYLDIIAEVRGETEYHFIQGWLVNTTTRAPATLIRIVDSNNLTQGFALGGQVRTDVATAIGAYAETAGFGGYMTLPDTDSSIRLIADNNACELGNPALPEIAGELN